MVGNTIIIILLIPILIAVLRIAIRQEQSHRKVMDRLAEIERLVPSTSGDDVREA